MSSMGGPGSNSAQAATIPAINSYTTFANAEKATILADTSIDSISKQELLNQLQQGFSDIQNSNTTNSNTDIEISQADAANVQNQLVSDASDSALYQGRRFLEQQYIQQQNQPGRAETILTARTNTPAGTPTLLTSSPGGSGGVDLTTPGSILTGKS